MGQVRERDDYILELLNAARRDLESARDTVNDHDRYTWVDSARKRLEDINAYLLRRRLKAS